MQKQFKGFTMVELLVAMAIIGLLIATAIWGIGIAQQSARNTQRREAGAQIVAGFNEYYARYNRQASFAAFGADGICLCGSSVDGANCNATASNCYFVALNGIAKTSAVQTGQSINAENGIRFGATTSASNSRYIIGNGADAGGTLICIELEGGGAANLSDPQSLVCPSFDVHNILPVITEPPKVGN